MLKDLDAEHAIRGTAGKREGLNVPVYVHVSISEAALRVITQRDVATTERLGERLKLLSEAMRGA